MDTWHFPAEVANRALNLPFPCRVARVLLQTDDTLQPESKTIVDKYFVLRVLRTIYELTMWVVWMVSFYVLFCLMDFTILNKKRALGV